MKNRDEDALDFKKLRPQASTEREAREDAERRGFDLPDGRTLRRKGRTVTLSFKVRPETKQMLQQMAIAENRSQVEVIEEALEHFRDQLAGRKGAI